MTAINMNIGKAIKQVRKQVGLTQQELSATTGISQTSISKIEGGAKPGDKTLKKICTALDVPAAVIYMLALDETDIPNSKKSKFKMLFPVITNLAMEIVGPKNKKLLTE